MYCAALGDVYATIPLPTGFQGLLSKIGTLSQFPLRTNEPDAAHSPRLLPGSYLWTGTTGSVVKIRLPASSSTATPVNIPSPGAGCSEYHVLCVASCYDIWLSPVRGRVAAQWLDAPRCDGYRARGCPVTGDRGVGASIPRGGGEESSMSQDDDTTQRGGRSEEYRCRE